MDAADSAEEAQEWTLAASQPATAGRDSGNLAKMASMLKDKKTARIPITDTIKTAESRRSRFQPGADVYQTFSLHEVAARKTQPPTHKQGERNIHRNRLSTDAVLDILEDLH